MSRVVTYHPKFLPDFVALNREWIDAHFVIEPMDIHQLENPDRLILEPGGEIFFILDDDDKVVGTVAMIPHGERSFELAKMAVRTDQRGKGYGDMLIVTAKNWALKKNAESITLLSNTILSPAIALYTKHGFQTVHLGKHPDYDRCNIEMVFTL